MIKMEHVSKTYQTGVPALNDISLHIRPGEFAFITGPSGSGKSTLIKLLLDELKPSKGKILVNGKNLAGISHRNIPYYRRNIGVVFQDFRLLQDRNVYENVAFAMKVIESSNRKIKKSVP
jgi:cell division transport system ATP-binding protein